MSKSDAEVAGRGPRIFPVDEDENFMSTKLRI